MDAGADLARVRLLVGEDTADGNREGERKADDEGEEDAPPA